MLSVKVVQARGTSQLTITIRLDRYVVYCALGVTRDLPASWITFRLSAKRLNT